MNLTNEAAMNLTNEAAAGEANLCCGCAAAGEPQCWEGEAAFEGPLGDVVACSGYRGADGADG
ncbi:MAG: hypothetical protein LBJ10_01645, partial [Clostridiales bacterium]|nr:hypothetical protein [Clostridiales bacterium]